MARLIPDSALNDPEMTPGERRATRGLYQTLDDSTVIWYQPRLAAGRRPDLILYLPGIGIVLYEVKDWSLNNIRKATADTWTIVVGGEREKAETNPFKRVRSYYYNLNERLSREPSFTCADERFKGKLIFPIATAVIFPNIAQGKYCEAGLADSIDDKYILFKNDIDALGLELSGKPLFDRIKKHFDPWWPHDELTGEQLDRLRGILYPEITSTQKDKGGGKIDIILDEHQEQVAKKIGEGHRVVRGVAGSGKSLVLCAKARLLVKEHPNWKILITCYNISLASQLQYYLNSFSQSSEESAEPLVARMKRQVDVVHFHGLCGRTFKNTGTQWPRIQTDQVLHTAGLASLSECEKESKLDDMGSALLGQVLQLVASTKQVDRYDAILVDESQDFHPSWLKALLLLLNGQSNFLLLAEDPNQKIYPRTFSYKEAGIDVVGGGRVFNLPIGYRSTREIILPASRIVITSNWDDFFRKFIEEEQGASSPSVTKAIGDYPHVVIKSHYEDLCDFVVQSVQKKLGEGYHYSDIGIIYVTRSRKQAVPESQFSLLPEEQNIDYIGSLRARLALNNIPHYWLTENRDSKQHYDQFRDAVTISTLFSAKGLEWSIVYLVGLELYPWAKRNPRENASMIYVGMTRARSEVYLLSTERTSLVSNIEKIIAEIKISPNKASHLAGDPRRATER